MTANATLAPATTHATHPIRKKVFMAAPILLAVGAREWFAEHGVSCAAESDAHTTAALRCFGRGACSNATAAPRSHEFSVDGAMGFGEPSVIVNYGHRYQAIPCYKEPTGTLTPIGR